MPASHDEQAHLWKADFGRRLREMRLSRGMSQMQLAHEVGLDPTYISSVERGRRNISLVNIHSLAVALSVPPASLLSDEGLEEGAPVACERSPDESAASR